MSHQVELNRRHAMNNAIKTTLVVTSLFASASIFANTTTTGASASGQVTTSAEVQTNHKGVISSLNQGVHNAADKVGHGIEKGVDNTKTFTQEKWQDTKEFASEKNAVAKEKTQAVKDKLSEKSEVSKDATKEKSKTAQEKLVAAKDKTKQSVANGWQKTKDVLTPDAKQAGLSSNSNIEVNTPVGSAKGSLSTDGNVKAQ